MTPAQAAKLLADWLTGAAQPTRWQLWQACLIILQAAGEIVLSGNTFTTSEYSTPSNKDAAAALYQLAGVLEAKQVHHYHDGTHVEAHIKDLEEKLLDKKGVGRGETSRALMSADLVRLKAILPKNGSWQVPPWLLPFVTELVAKLLTGAFAGMVS